MKSWSKSIYRFGFSVRRLLKRTRGENEQNFTIESKVERWIIFSAFAPMPFALPLNQIRAFHWFGQGRKCPLCPGMILKIFVGMIFSRRNLPGNISLYPTSRHFSVTSSWCCQQAWERRWSHRCYCRGCVEKMEIGLGFLSCTEYRSFFNKPRPFVPIRGFGWLDYAAKTSQSSKSMKWVKFWTVLFPIPFNYPILVVYDLFIAISRL